MKLIGFVANVGLDICEFSRNYNGLRQDEKGPKKQTKIQALIIKVGGLRVEVSKF